MCVSVCVMCVCVCVFGVSVCVCGGGGGAMFDDKFVYINIVCFDVGFVVVFNVIPIKCIA